jgi:phosphatidylglycerol:prolipoprotein diacylglycerol transferase
MLGLNASLGFWVHDLDPYLVRFAGDFGIRWYGLAYVAGFAASAWLLVRYARAGRSRVQADDVWNFMTALVIGVMLGGRLGSYFLYDGWRAAAQDPLGVLRVWEGGMASHGGFVGVAAALAWFAWSRKIQFLHLSDLVTSTAAAGLFFGRVANFINGELWGRISTVQWAVIFPQSAPGGTPIGMIPPRHPSQLYEALLEGALLFAIMQWRFWKTTVVSRLPGRLSGEFLLGYSILRVLGEAFREPDASLYFGLTRGTFYSLPLIPLGIYLIVRAKRTPQAT